MISILISWIIIGTYAYLYGRVCISMFYGKQIKTLQTWDVYVICGLMFLTVYAQLFSLFCRVGLLAFVIMSIGTVACMAYLIISNQRITFSTAGIKKRFKIRNLILLVGVLGTLLWTNIIPQHYDTALYHAQAIRWIEEYGVVPGLANLHFRLAYNSAFLSLQALFSFVWLTGVSMHTVNGFIVVYMLSYAVISFGKNDKRKVLVSDLLKIAVPAYFFYISMYISSPNTDISALLLLFYICIKWSEFAEEEIKSALPYSFLCLLCVYEITIKLSAAIFVCLTIYPAFLLIKNRQWKQIGSHIVAGIFVLIPYLIRNVMISGYLVYPYPEIDLFHVDWKMAEQIALEDRREIVAWARGNQDVSRYRDTISEWFPEWFMNIHILWRVLFAAAMIAAVILLFIVIENVIWGKTDKSENILSIVSIAGMFFWVFSAPLPRYGVVYMIFLPCMALGRLAQNDAVKKHIKQSIYSRIHRGIYITLMSLIMLYCLCFFFYGRYTPYGSRKILMQNDYQNHDVIEENIGGIIVSRAAEGDQTGYSPFPTTPYLGAIESIELRGESLKEGFRRKSY